MRFTIGRATLVAAAAAAALVLLGACSPGEGSPAATPTPTVTPTPRPMATATPTPTPTSTPTPTPPPAPTPVPEVGGFRFPIEGACLPTSPNLLPNAPRPYRLGIHEGIDFYDGLACASISRGTPVLAAKAGTVSRADVEYVEMTPQERDYLLTLSQNQGYTDPATLDKFRGRQAWIDHGGGLVTRYAHLSAIAEGIVTGVFVEAGQVIGFVGNSGTPEGITDPNADIHLHFEIRVGDSYLGQGLPLAEMMAVLERAFSP